MAEIKTKFDQLFDLANGTEPHIIKADQGNKAAARRARKNLLAIKNLAHELRKDIQASTK